MKATIRSLALAGGLILSGTALGHHSFTEYDSRRTIEIAGKLLEVSWRNPHVHLKVQSHEADGRIRIWDVDAHDP